MNTRLQFGLLNHGGRERSRWSRLNGRMESSARFGTTLTEVLISLLVIGIGVVSVATLFPLSLTRAARATQLTAAAGVMQNALNLVEYSYVPNSRIDSRAMLFDPDGNGDTETYGPPGSFYRNRQRGLGGTGTIRKYVVDPLGAAVLIDQRVPGVFEPLIFGSLTDQDGNDLSRAIDGDSLRFAWPFDAARLAGFTDGMPNPDTGLNDADDQLAAIDLANLLVGKGGSFEQALDVPATVTVAGGQTLGSESGTGTLITFDARDVDAGALESYDPDRDDDGTVDGDSIGARVVLFDESNRRSIALPVVAAADRQLLVESVPAGLEDTFLPTVGTPPPTEHLRRVVVQVPELRYSWLLTVTRLGEGRGTAAFAGHVVVFFNRSLSPEDEAIWRCGYDENERGYRMTVGTRGRLPTLVAGTHFMDAETMNWYRVGQVEVADDGNSAFFTLPELRRVRNEAGTSDVLHANFMRGVVDVYPFQEVDD